MTEIPEDVMKRAEKVLDLLHPLSGHYENTMEIARAIMAAEKRATEAAWQPIETVPLNVEVLAFHERSQNWHQVRWNGRVFTMRWHENFQQFLADYTHWMPLPPPPASKGASHDQA